MKNTTHTLKTLICLFLCFSLLGTKAAAMRSTSLTVSGTDLELDLQVDQPFPAIYTPVVFTANLNNTGTTTAHNIKVDLPIPNGILAFTGVNTTLGNYATGLQEWQLDSLSAGSSATINLTLFTLTADPLDYYIEVKSMLELDMDSTPGNGNAPVVAEDDEALVKLNSSTVCEGILLLDTQADIDAFGPCTFFDGDIVVGNNAQIENLDALASLEEVSGNLIIGAPNLTNINGLANLRKVGKTFVLHDLENITSFAALQYLDSVGVNLEITANRRIKDLHGLNNLQAVGKSFYVLSNDSLQSLTGINQLNSIGDQMVINGHPFLLNLDGLNALQSVGLDVFISDNALLDNLDALDNLSSIATDLNITNNPALTSCCGIYNLLRNNGVGGTILLENNPAFCNDPATILADCAGPCDGSFVPTTQAEVDAFGPCTIFDGNIVISKDTEIQNLDSLAGLVEITGTLVLDGKNLESIAGLADLRKVGQTMLIRTTEQLTAVTGLEQLDSVGEDIFVSSNLRLKNLEGMQNLEFVGKGFYVFLNDSIESIGQFSLLQEVDDLFVIDRNPLLKNLDGLEALQTIGGSLVVNNNDALESIEGLANLVSVGFLNINGNPALTSCCALYDLLQNNGVSGTINLSDNPAFCNDVATILGDCGPVCSGVFTPASQAELDAFGPCTVFDGDIIISAASQIQNLDALAGLEIVTGDLRFFSPDLTNINGLSSLKKVGKNFSINQLSNLTSLNALQQLDSVNGAFNLAGNHLLTDLQGLENLEHTGALFIGANDNLQSLTGLVQLKNIPGILSIIQTPLESLEGLNALDSVGMEIMISGNSNLKNLNGLNQVQKINGNLFLLSNDSLQTLDGLQQLNSVGSQLVINDNSSLLNLDGLNALQSVNLNVFISDNLLLENLDALDHLTFIATDLYITNNPALTSCCGIYNLLSGNGLGGTATLTDNPSFCNDVATILSDCAPPVCSGNFVPTSQAEVDAFGPCTTWDGDIVLTSSAIQNLDALSGLEEVTGSLVIRGDSLENLNGLSSLQKVGTSLFLEHLKRISSFADLEQLDTIGNEIYISHNPLIKNLAGLENIEFIESGFYLLANDSIETTGLLSFTDQLSGLFVIDNNPRLKNLDGFESLQSVGGRLFVARNDSLQNIDGLANVLSANDLEVRNNPVLSSCCALYNLLNNNGVSGTIRLEDNTAFCNDVATILSDCAPVCAGNFVPLNQAEMDAFPGTCTTWEGSIVINPDVEIQNLDALINLEEVTETFYIDSPIGLENINGLSNLRKVGTGFYLWGLDEVTTFEPLQELDSVGVILYIRENLRIKNLQGLENLEYIGMNFLVFTNDSLQALASIPQIQHLDGSLRINGNPQLKNLDGLSALQSLGQDLTVQDNDLLENLDGLENLSAIARTMRIRNNPVLTNCCGIYNLLNNNGVGEFIFIEDNPAFCSNASEILDNCVPNRADLQLQLSADPPDPALFNNTTLSLQVTNTGGIDATGIVIDFPIPEGYAIVSKSKTLGNYNTWPTGVWTIDLLPAGQSATLLVTIFALTEDPATAFAQVTAMDQIDEDSVPDNNDCLNDLPNCAVQEDDEALAILNAGSGPLLLPDLRVNNLSGPANGEAGQGYDFTFTLINDGTAVDPMQYFSRAYLSTDTQLSNQDIEIGQILSSGTPLATFNGISISVNIHAGQLPGDYFIILKADSEDVIPELNENNNTTYAPFTIDFPNAANCTGDTVLATQAEVDAFGPCVVYNGNIRIAGPDINDLSSFAGLQQINGNFRINNCVMLTSFAGLEDLTRVEGAVTFQLNSNLESMDRLQSFSYAESVNILGNDKLTDLAGLEGITTIPGWLQINDDDGLTSLNGLQNLTQVQTIDVIICDVLTSIEALQSLETVDEILTIAGNPLLPNINGLEQLNSVGVFRVGGNASLSECCSILDLVTTPGAIVDSLVLGPNNLFFCNSRQDIIDNCTANGADLEVSISASQPDFAAWQILSITVQVNNTGNSLASDIVVDFPLPYGTVFTGGNEYSASQGTYDPFHTRLWNVGNLDAGASALITFNLFTKEESTLLAYTEVLSMTETDIDSSPGNGTCDPKDATACTANEDDEALIVLQSTSNRLAPSSTIPDPRIRSLAPNPAVDQIELVIESPHIGNYQIEVYNAWGKLEKTEILDLQAGLNFIDLQIAEFNNGTYFLVLLDGHRRGNLNHFIKINP